jgi:transposase InsO family protein
VAGKKYWIVICIDDYSRYIVLCELFEECPTTKEITDLLETIIRKTKRKPEKILTDHGAQFQDLWKRWCSANKIEQLFAHPYYPQDKGKVERSIRNLVQEFVKLLRKFPEWLSRISEYVGWYNDKRFHRGISDYPANLYVD